MNRNAALAACGGNLLLHVQENESYDEVGALRIGPGGHWTR